MEFIVTSYREPVGKVENHLLVVAKAWAKNGSVLDISTLPIFAHCMVRELTWYVQDNPTASVATPCINRQPERIEILTEGYGRLCTIQLAP